MLENKDAFETAMVKFEMTGIETICQRIYNFWNGKNEKNCTPDTVYGFERLS